MLWSGPLPAPRLSPETPAHVAGSWKGGGAHSQLSHWSNGCYPQRAQRGPQGRLLKTWLPRAPLEPLNQMGKQAHGEDNCAGALLAKVSKKGNYEIRNLSLPCKKESSVDLMQTKQQSLA